MLILCNCGCEELISDRDSKNRPRYFKNGHNNRKPIENRFWEKVNKSFSCWLWTASVDKKGYGNFKTPYSNKAHQYSWYLHNNTKPTEGLWVLHACDTPSCVNPEHLFLGTCNDNNQDMITKGRAWFQNKTHCIHGHEYNDETIYINSQGARSCKICAKAAQKRFYDKV